ncbi:putative disease resistance protein [Vitis vinifera]|uniref:Putative disease resistance protein n=1 Tax=Vitis vinifera TaxID=29760 RepID=A0A438FH59_VITVI|nr:putative disease resistance protein [Vitis vinifera]
MERLKGREHDINTILKNAQYDHRKKEKKEVENWLIEVQHMKDRAQKIEQEAAKKRCFSRLRFLSQSEDNIKQVDELIELGKFPDGILIDVLQDEGMTLLTTQLIGETTTKRILEKIWTCLEKGEIQSIGVWGMGGIGKTIVVTHIYNRLLENSSTFGQVYWVTISKESSIHDLQDAIAEKFNIEFSEEGDDDKRSRNICLGMGCKEIIKVESLSTEEAWELFNKTLERYSALNGEEEKTAKDIVNECAGLPLAIVTTAKSMRGVYDIFEWRNALNELRGHTQGPTLDMENDVFKILEFSYDRLNDEKLWECLLYCALFPEDYWIRRASLIRYWIAEGMVGEMETRQAEFDRGHAILNKLENVCLLERRGNGKCVKVHDVIRDMVINISKRNSRFMVRAGRNLNDLSSEIQWLENLERVSLMDSQLSSLKSVPNCPKLSTLLLLSKYGPDGLPNAFFVHMPSLKVLNLSYLNISSLPYSISNLVNLRALFLCHCSKLNHVPSLAKLKELRELDLSGSGITELPDGIELLALLKCLALRGLSIKDMSLNRALPNLLHLQCLRLDDMRFLMLHENKAVPETHPLLLRPRVPNDPRNCQMDERTISTNIDGGRAIITLRAADKDRVNDPDNHIRMTYVGHPDVLWKPSGCFMLISVVCPSLRQSGYEKRITCIRIGVIWMIMRVTCYYEISTPLLQISAWSSGTVFCIPNGVLVEFLDEEEVVSIEKAKGHAITFSKEQFNVGILNMLFNLELSLLEVLFVYSLKKGKNDIFSMAAHLPSLQLVTELSDSTKGGAKGYVVVRGAWAGLLEHPERCHNHLWFVDNACSDKRGHVVEWVEKASFVRLNKLFEIIAIERQYATLLTARNLMVVVRESGEYIINIIPRKLSKKVVPGEHYILKDLPFYKQVQQADAEKRRVLLVDRERRKKEGTLRKAPGKKWSASSPPAGALAKKKKKTFEKGKEVEIPPPPKEVVIPPLTYVKEVTIKKPEILS